MGRGGGGGERKSQGVLATVERRGGSGGSGGGGGDAEVDLRLTSTRMVARLYRVAVCSGFQNKARRKQSTHSSHSPRAYHMLLEQEGGEGETTTGGSRGCASTSYTSAWCHPRVRRGTGQNANPAWWVDSARTPSRSSHWPAAPAALAGRRPGAGSPLGGQPPARWLPFFAPSTPCHRSTPNIAAAMGVVNGGCTWCGWNVCVYFVCDSHTHTPPSHTQASHPHFDGISSSPYARRSAL